MSRPKDPFNWNNTKRMARTEHIVHRNDSSSLVGSNLLQMNLGQTSQSSGMASPLLAIPPYKRYFIYIKTKESEISSEVSSC